MFTKTLMTAVIVLSMSFSNSSFGQRGHGNHGGSDNHGGHDDHDDHGGHGNHGGSGWHFGFGGSGGHFDLHNGHIDYHQPGHFDLHNGHIDYHPGHVDHYIPTGGNYVNPYYYNQPVIGNSVIYGNNSYNPNSVYRPGIVNNVPPSRPLPSSPVIAGYVPNQGPINLVNPAIYDTPLSFKINGEPVSLESGQDTTIAFDRHIVIEFHRGGDFGSAKYSLRDGNYKFVVGDQGWDIKKVLTTPAADATSALPDTNALPANPLPGDRN